MVRLTAIFVAICIILIGLSLGVLSYLLMGSRPAEAVLIALAAMTALSLYAMVSHQVRTRNEVGDQIADLSRAAADVARWVAELDRKVSGLEARPFEDEEERPAALSLAAEIGELGALVKQLAETVAVHDARLSAAAESAAQPAPNTAAGPATAGFATMPAAPAEGANAGPKQAGGGEVTALVRSAVAANRIELHLQPIVTLPQRKVRYYEALTRLRTEQGNTVSPAEFIPAAEAAGLMPAIDNLMLFRAVQVVRRLMVKNRDIGIFCNVSASTLADADGFSQILQFLEANRVLAPSLILEFRQKAWRGMGLTETTNLAALADHGFRFSVDHVTDLRMEPRDLLDRSIRFIKVPGEMLLNRSNASDIHAADLSDLLGRFGISLIAEKIEAEAIVVDLLDYDVRFGQGMLFSPPRPVRADALGAAPARDDAVVHDREGTAKAGLPRREADSEMPGGASDRATARLGIRQA